MGNMIRRPSVRGHSWGRGSLGHTQHWGCLLGSRAVHGMQLAGCKGCQLLLQRMAGVWSSTIFCCSPPVCQNYCTWDYSQALLCLSSPVYLNALNCHFFLTLDYFHRGVSAAGLGEAVSGRCWVDGENVPRTFGEASWPAALAGAVGAVLGAAAFPHMPALQAVQSHRDTSPGPLAGRGTLITMITLHPCGQKLGKCGLFLISHTSSGTQSSGTEIWIKLMSFERERKSFNAHWG